MRTPTRRVATAPLVLALALLALAALACSGGGSGGGGATTGRVGVLITDAPHHDFDRIDLTVARIELIGERRVELFSGLKTIDLLSLENYSNLVALADGVPAVDFTKVRLTLGDLVLVRTDDDGEDEERIRPKLPGGGKLDLVPRQVLTVRPGETLMLEIDVEAEKAVHFRERGNGEWIFRPVAFVRPVDPSGGGPGGGPPDAPGELEKLSRVEGTVEAILGDGLLLCAPDVLIIDVDGDGVPDPVCLTVRLYGDTAAFDASGAPTGLGGLGIGDPATVVGELRLPPAGASAEAPVLELDAVVIELGPPGTFTRWSGLVAGPVDPLTDAFDFDVDPGQGLPDPTVLPTRLQTGTAVVSRRGFRLPDGEIAAGVPAEVDGVLDPDAASPERIRAALVLLEQPPSDLDEATGAIADLDVAGRSFDLLTDEGGLCVDVVPDALLLALQDTGAIATSTAITLADLADGRTATVIGTDGACFRAVAVLAE